MLKKLLFHHLPSFTFWECSWNFKSVQTGASNIQVSFQIKFESVSVLKVAKLHLSSLRLPCWELEHFPFILHIKIIDFLSISLQVGGKPGGMAPPHPPPGTQSWILVITELHRYQGVGYKSDIVVISGQWLQISLPRGISRNSNQWMECCQHGWNYMYLSMFLFGIISKSSIYR